MILILCTDVVLIDSTSLYNKNLYAYCDNNSVNRIDIDGYMWELALAGGSAMVSGYGVSMGAILTALSAIAPIAMVVVAAAVAGAIAYDYVENHREKSKTKKPKTATKNSDLSTPASPEPLNNKGKGTIVTSKTLYSKGGKEVFRLDVENPDTRSGQIHVHMYGGKYYYNIGRGIFVNSPDGPAAPPYVQKILEKMVIKAIERGLTILGY